MIFHKKYRDETVFTEKKQVPEDRQWHNVVYGPNKNGGLFQIPREYHPIWPTREKHSGLKKRLAHFAMETLVYVYS